MCTQKIQLEFNERGQPIYCFIDNAFKYYKSIYTMLIARKRSTVLLKKANADFLELFMSVWD